MKSINKDVTSFSASYFFLEQYQHISYLNVVCFMSDDQANLQIQSRDVMVNNIAISH